jgi:formylglycine-generating enzyme
MTRALVAVALLFVCAAGCVTLLGVDDVSYRAPRLEAGTTPVTVDDRCPQGRGPVMLRIEKDEANSSFCIDATEVTVAQYRDFAKSNAPLNADSRCTWNDNADPPSSDEAAENPITSIDFCDAVAFCSWANKTLCGATDGRPSPPNDAGGSAWLLACSANGRREYPYGSMGTTFSDKACNIGTRVEPVKSRTSCQGGYAALYDMGGNAAEWINACESRGDAGLLCTTTYALGAGLPAAKQDLRKCSAAFEGEDPIQTKRPTLGFRCCARALD